MSHTQRWQPICPRLRRVQEKARANRGEVFTSLAHYVDEAALLRAYRGLRAGAAAGADGHNKASYGKGVKGRLSALHERLVNGSYRATPTKRVVLSKPDGGERSIHLQTVEDKIVQGAVVEVLNSIYEVDFAAFSYGFRPGKSAHQCLQALQTALQKGRVNWVLDLDLKACFDSIEHEALMAQVQQRVKDRSVLRLLRDALTVGYRDDNGRRQRQHRGVPQGAVISPLLANIVLNEAMDKTVHRWRQNHARGQVYIVRYADDAVIGFEYETDAQALRAELETALSAYGLSLNEAKTRLVRFGRRNPPNGPGRSDSFDFLGFTHIAGRDRKGRFLVKRKTARKRLSRQLEAFKHWCRAHRHEPMAWQHRKLSEKLAGHYAYFGIRGNQRSMACLRAHVWHYWRQCLRRRSQNSRMRRLTRLLNECFILPHPRITHPDNWLALDPGDLLGRAGCGKAARPVL